MAEYNIYRIVRLDMGGAIPIYVGMTDRTYEIRWSEHKQSCDGLYKVNCKNGRKGDVKNPNTTHGARANASLFHFIREELDGIDGLNAKWRFEEIANADKQTEDDWIDLYISMGYRLFNLKQGEGHIITKRAASGVDLTGCKTIEDVAVRRAEYETEKKRKQELRKIEALERKKRRDEEQEIPILKIRYECIVPVIIESIQLWENLSRDEQETYNSSWDTLYEWLVDYNTYLHVKNTKKLKEALGNCEHETYELQRELS